MRNFDTGFSFKDLFESKESKAMTYFGFGSSKELSASGRDEFVDFIFNSQKELKDSFLKKVKEAYDKVQEAK